MIPLAAEVLILAMVMTFRRFKDLAKIKRGVLLDAPLRQPSALPTNYSSSKNSSASICTTRKNRVLCSLDSGSTRCIASSVSKVSTRHSHWARSVEASSR